MEKNNLGISRPPAQKIVVEELSAAGLRVEKIVEDWAEGSYCVLFVKE